MRGKSMNLNLEKKLKVLGFCGVMATAGNMAGFYQDVRANPPKTEIGDDGHPAAVLSTSQSMEVLGGLSGVTIAGAAFMFGAALRKEKEKAAQIAMQAAAKAASR